MRKMITATIVTIFVIASSGNLFAEDRNEPTEKNSAVEARNGKKQRAEKAGRGKSEDTKATEDSKKQDAASQLTKGSVWRGDRWRGQASSIEGPQASNDVKVTMREGNQVTLTAKKWAGAQGRVNWTFEINGKQLTCKTITFEGGGGTATFEEISGTGTIEGDVLRFEVSARQKSPKFNGTVHEKLVLKKAG